MRCLFLFSLLISMTACLKTHSQLEGEKNLNLRGIAHIKDSPDSVSQQQRAQIDSRFYDIDRDFRELYGKIEVMEKQLSQLTNSLENRPQDSSMNSEKIQNMEKQITTLERALLTIDGKLDELIGEKPEKDKKKRDKKSKREKTKETKKKNSDKKNKKSKDLFAKAESFFNQGEFEEAIVQYDKYRKTSPKGREYPHATFKMGLCFQKLNMDEDAKAFYKELIQRYPKSPFAGKAEKILKSMKK